MRILLNNNVYGWKMTGLLGKDGKWFLGFSRSLRDIIKERADIVSNRSFVKEFSNTKF